MSPTTASKYDIFGFEDYDDDEFEMDVENEQMESLVPPRATTTQPQPAQNLRNASSFEMGISLGCASESTTR